MKVIVTGGAGFIGSNLVKALICKGAQVTVIDNLISGYKDNLKPFLDINFVEGDVRDAALLDRIMSGVQVIYHLAASVGNKRSIDNPLLDADINVMGTLQVLEAARRHKVKKIIVSSSAGIFGELKELPIKETHPIDPRTPYASSKLYAEKVALAYSEIHGMEVVCLRYFNVYGPNQRFDAYGNVIPIFVFKMLNGEILSIYGDGEQTRDFVNVKDVVQANIKSAETPGLSGAFNIASGTQVSVNHLINRLKAISGIDPILNYTAPRLGDVRDSLADISAARTMLKYNPEISFEEGLVEYVNWAKQEHDARAPIS